jgi:hypothetical protein
MFAVVTLCVLAAVAAPASAQEIVAARQFGTPDFDVIYQVDDRAGDVFGIGEEDAAPGGCDVLLTRMGSEKWTQRFGTDGCDFAEGIAVGGDALYTGGATDGGLGRNSNLGGFDAFVRAFDLDGSPLWTRQFGSSANDFARGAAADADAFYVVGSARGPLGGQPYHGSADAFVRKYDANGNVLWTREFGTAGIDVAREVDIVDGYIVVAGQVQGTLPGTIGAGGTDAFVRMYTAGGKEVWTRQLGSTGEDVAWGVDAFGDSVYIAGDAGGALPGQTFAGGPLDAFAASFRKDGRFQWIREFGTEGFDRAIRVAADAEKVVVVGRVGGALPGQTFAGGDTDPFVRRYDPAGNEGWTLQFGGELEPEAATGVSIDDTDGEIFASGGIGGTLPGETSEGYIDAFIMTIADDTAA